MPENERQGRSTWTNVAAVLGAVAALITAAVGAVALFNDDDEGGNRDPAGDTRAEPTRPDWARQAAKVCERFRDETASLSRVDPNDPQQAISALEQGAAGIRSASDDLSGIPAPSQDEADIQELISIVDQEAQTADLMARAIVNQDRPTFHQLLVEAESFVRRENSLWRRLGVRGCAA